MGSPTSTICIGTVYRSGLNVIGQVPCNSPYSYAPIVPPNSITPPLYSITPSFSGPLTLPNNLCMDGTNINAVAASACNGSPEQLWIHQFGQIRNVANGLCLDAKNANGATPATTAVQVQVMPSKRYFSM